MALTEILLSFEIDNDAKPVNTPKFRILKHRHV